jgi:hypothetical protein
MFREHEHVCVDYLQRQRHNVRRILKPRAPKVALAVNYAGWDTGLVEDVHVPVRDEHTSVRRIIRPA